MTAQIKQRPGPKVAAETLPEQVEGCLFGVTLELLGARVPTPTEHSVFEAYGLDYVAPEDRQ